MTTLNDMRDRIAIVTGASRGIGAAIARALAGEGAQVALVARSADDLEDVRAGIEAAGGTAWAVPADMAREDEVRRAVQAAVAHGGRVDILVNCAGIGVFAPLAETTLEDWDRVMAVNARGPFLMCREALPHMSAGGCIINIASVVGVKGYVRQGAYTASKHALLGMTKVLAQEVQPRGIRVHAVCPGGVDTDMVASARPDLDRSDLMTPDEVADIVLFLIHQPGRAVVDQINVRRATSAPWFD
jgi:3-oxoacyl-[acyl-carrier protein] reductase